MKYCSKCGNQLKDESVICPKCGCKVYENNNEGNFWSILGLVFCIFPIPILAIIFGIIGYNKAPQYGGKGRIMGIVAYTLGIAEPILVAGIVLIFNR